MATATGLPTGNGRARPHPSLLPTLVGPVLLLAGGVLTVAGLFLPWWHFQICDSSVDVCQPYVPAGATYDPTVVLLYVMVAIALVAGLFSLALHGLPSLRSRSTLLPWAILLGAAALVAGLCGTGWMALFSVFFNFLAVDLKILDSGYFVALAGVVLLVPGSLMVVITESRWRAASRPVPVPVPGTDHPKSIRRGLLLETFVAGTGASYAGRSSMGLGWSLGTYVGGPIIGLSVFLAINTLDGLADNATENRLSLFPTAAILLILGIFIGSWLAARLWVVHSWLQRYNQSLAAPAPLPPPIVRPPAFDDGQVVSSAASALGASVFVLMIGSVLFANPPLNPPQMLAELIPLAFWLALVHLRQPSSSLAAFGKVLAWVAVTALAIVLTSLALNAVLIPGYTTSYLHLADLSTRTLALVGLFVYVLPVLLAGSIGFSIALFFADWREVRRRVGRQAPHLLRAILFGMLPLFGIIAFLPVAAIHRRLVVDVFETNRNLFLVLDVLIPLAGCLWIGAVAALTAGLRLKRLPVAE